MEPLGLLSPPVPFVTLLIPLAGRVPLGWLLSPPEDTEPLFSVEGLLCEVCLGGLQGVGPGGWMACLLLEPHDDRFLKSSGRGGAGLVGGCKDPALTDIGLSLLEASGDAGAIREVGVFEGVSSDLAAETR